MKIFIYLSIIQLINSFITLPIIKNIPKINKFTINHSNNHYDKENLEEQSIFSNIDKYSLSNVTDIMKQSDGYAVLSTIGSTNKLYNYPLGSIVGFSTDSLGYPIFAFSKISSHTRNLLKNNSSSLCITGKEFKNASHRRVTFTGDILPVNNKDEELLVKKNYLNSHKKAVWINFDDFQMYKMYDIKDIYYIGGFAKTTRISVSKYLDKFNL